MFLTRSLRVTTRAMAGALLGVSLPDQIWNEKIRERNRVINVAQIVAKLKWITEGRWGTKVLDSRKRSVLRLPTSRTGDYK
ncbi:jg17654 [Pararge aegeria aegeria]|uniref:Jg17654 protein n=1 Tax=Pararge aegeria aegeria TaxID=348720 RepID=A0A8S4RJV1_9NEOP|nr:jg17654 [Pararge aegeria aegeria]